jgi:uncharacterized flavoprotein (TIGR03862 family)
VTISKLNIAVIGAGPAGLMAAEVLAQGGAEVTVFDAMPSVGRKFLMAGRGGLNLTHGEPLSSFLTRYHDANPQLLAAIEAFPPDHLRAWCEGLGQPTFVGSSGRIFPKTLKASPLLRAWLRRLDGMGVRFRLRHGWTGWHDGGGLVFETPNGEEVVDACATVLALGGASWPRLGSDGGWVETLRSRGVKVHALEPANCGFRVNWSEVFRERFQGIPLKDIALSFAGRSVRGEAMITRDGIEGGAVYALSADVRDAILDSAHATLHVTLRPDISSGDLIRRLSAPRGKQSFSNWLRKVTQLSPVGIGLLQEVSIKSGVSLASLPADKFADFMKAVPIELTGVAPIARAISSAGGIGFDELDAGFMIHRLPGVFAAGEMLDWEAPTGGYLLQACFATGVAAGRGALRWMDSVIPGRCQRVSAKRGPMASNPESRDSGSGANAPSHEA